MASEYYECTEEISTTSSHDILDGEVVKEEPTEIEQFSKYGNEQNASGNQDFIMKGEIVEDPTETKPFIEYGVFNECLGKNEKETFYDLNSSKFHVTQRNSVPKEPKFSTTNSWENTDFNVFAGELAKPKFNNFDNGIILKNEDEGHSKCTEDSPTNGTELKTETFKTEYDIDIIHEDIKPHTIEEKSSGKNGNQSYLNPVTDILIGTKIGANLFRELPKVSLWFEQASKMASSTHGKYVAQLSITDIEEGENGQIERGSPFYAIHDILNGEVIKEEPTETKPFNEDSEESKLSLIRFEENTNFNILADDSAKPKVDQFNDIFILKHEHEDHCECIDDLWTNNAELKTEDDIDIVYEDVKPEICEEKDYKIWPLHSIEGDETAADVKRSILQEHIAEHEKIHTGEKPFQCQICSKSFFRKGHLMEHEIIHTGEKPFQCKVCPKSFAVKRRLLLHEKIHTGEKPFQCKSCLKSFTREKYLTSHEIIHTGEKPFRCKICQKAFSRKWDVTEHEKIHSGEKPFRCKLCPKRFALEKSLLIHEIIHTGEKPFQCKVCPKSFAIKRTLLLHEKIHIGENPFQCKICSNNFGYKSTLLRHERIHMGRNLFQCKICSKPFSQKVELTGHERIHTGEKPFQCKICLKSFSRKWYATEHEKFHRGEKPFQCAFCLKSFSRKNHLMSHERTHTGEKPFPMQSVSKRVLQ